MWEELQLVVERQNRMLASEAALMKFAIDTGIAAFGKKAAEVNREFRKIIDKLNGESPASAKKNMADLVREKRGNGR